VVEAGWVTPGRVDGVNATAICGTGIEAMSPDVHGLTVVVAQGSNGHAERQGAQLDGYAKGPFQNVHGDV
jgi:hypothetical protein